MSCAGARLQAKRHVGRPILRAPKQQPQFARAEHHRRQSSFRTGGIIAEVDLFLALAVIAG